jgi:ectoine hydroxylase-related dioxygenase (phytanoyl-CoA dioxygenase family)
MTAAITYRYEFAVGEDTAAAACLAEHGFAIVKGMLTPELLRDLRADVTRVLPPERIAEGGCAYSTDFVERSPAMWRLLQHAPYLRLYAAMLGTEEMTVHRSAAIVRRTGSAAGWHTDLPIWRTIDSANAVLNRWDDFPGGMWFYLGGSHPERGGLAVIADSHTPDWMPPAGFRLTPDRQVVEREDGSPAPLEVPGMVPMIGAPEDLILFGARTYHASFPHRGDQPRLSCAVGLRQRRIHVEVPWQLPEHARRFVADAPAEISRFFDGYVGIDHDWRPQAAAAAT